jgi:hypothetical protein
MILVPQGDGGMYRRKLNKNIESAIICYESNHLLHRTFPNTDSLVRVTISLKLQLGYS